MAMDGSNFTLDDPYTLIDQFVDEIIDVDPTHEQVSELLEILEPLYGCECGCEGRRHPRLARRVLHELAQLRMRINLVPKD